MTVESDFRNSTVAKREHHDKIEFAYRLPNGEWVFQEDAIYRGTDAKMTDDDLFRSGEWTPMPSCVEAGDTLDRLCGFNIRAHINV